MDEEKIRNLISIYQGLPPEMQNAVLWILEHIDIVDYLAQGEKDPGKELEDLIQEAVEKKDYLMVAMLVYKRVYDINH
ncbi:hypothetical protein [Eisenbergiella sp.]